MQPDYNTQREAIILKEYGRNVQNLVNYIRSIPDKAKRTEMAYTLIELIKQLAPVAKELTPENPHRMWDDLYIIADFNLDVDHPYDVPTREVVFKKPLQMEYPKNDVRFRHYGKNIEKLVKEAVKKETAEEREEAAIYLGKLMKTFYGAWNKETLDDSVIVKDILTMSQGKLTLSLDKVREDNLFEKLYREQRKKPHQNNNNNNNNNNKGGGDRNRNRPFNKNRHNNQHRRRDQ